MTGAANVLRIVLIGAESTGKTTLCRQLAEHYETVWVAEYGRELWERKLAAADPGPDGIPEWSDQDFIHIAEEQQRRENEAASRANRLVLCDTNAFATAIWYERYAGRRHAGVEAIGARDIADLYLLTAPDVPFIADGVRDGAGLREWMHARFSQELVLQRKSHIVITGPWETRFGQAVQAIDDLIGQACRTARAEI